MNDDEKENAALERISHIGEILHGVEHVYSKLPIFFKENMANVICSQVLSPIDAQKFDLAVRKRWWYQMHLDDLPVWGMVGEILKVEDRKSASTQLGHITGVETYLYTHKSFVIAYNGPRVISVNMTADDPVPIRAGETVKFSYSVEFVHTTENFDTRFVRYLDNDFFQHQIHWFSILNAFMMVLFLCGVVAVILIRTLKRDYAKYNLDDSELGALGIAAVDDSGWKQINGDVFRAPNEVMLLAVLLGNGAQLVVLFLLVAFTSLWGSFYMNRGATAKWSLIYYAMTSIVAGFVSGRFHKRNSHTVHTPRSKASRNDWKVVMLLTGFLLPAMGVMMLVYLNCFSIWYSTINVVPFKALLLIAALIALVCVPLSAVGTFGARAVTDSNTKVPCRVAAKERPIESRKWYLSVFTLVPACGLLPFGSIFIEMYFMFSSFWNYKFYYVYGFLLLVFIILTLVTICVTIVHTYTQLNFEDYRWQWPAFFSGGSVSVYVLCYSIYYYFAKTAMTGILQFSFYFTYMISLSVGLFILCGTIGYFGSELFVWRIYKGLRID
jgi:transmembrane 9 superfamily protein 3